MNLQQQYHNPKQYQKQLNMKESTIVIPKPMHLMSRLQVQLPKIARLKSLISQVLVVVSQMILVCKQTFLLILPCQTLSLIPI